MTARASRLGAASYEVEASWAVATDTWGTRLEVLGEPVIIQDPQQRTAEQVTQQYAEQGKMGIRGPWGGQFSIEMAFTGQGGTGGTGATTDTDLYDLMALVFGGSSSDCAGTDIATSTDAGEFTLTGGTVESGNMVRIGSKGDGRGDGQFVAVDAIGTTTLLTDMAAAANVADLVYAPLHIYPLESTGQAAITSTRWLLQSANGQWRVRGVYPMGVSISGTQTGEQPRINFTFGFSWIGEANETFPDLTATDAKDGGIVAGGSCFLQDVGTTTRQTYSMRAWTLDIDFQAQALMSPDTLSAYQVINGAIRLRCAASLSITADAEASGTNSFNDIYEAGVMQHCLITLNSVAGKAIGFYFKNCRPTNYVTQVAQNGLNARVLNLQALTGPTVTTEETMASFVIAMA